MDVRSRRALLATLALLMVGSVLMPAVLADSHEYRISVDDSVPIPEQTKQIDESGVEGEFSFSAIKAVDPGERFTARVDGVPGGDAYSLRVERFTDDGSLRIQGNNAMTGNDEATVGAPDTPGLYFLSAYTDNYESLYPFIVEEYDVGVDWGTVPDAAEVGSEISVSAEITRSTNPADRQQIKYVDVVIANEETLHNETLRLTEHSETSFTVSGSVTIEEGSLSPDNGPYSMYVAARGPDTVEGLRIPVGISEQRVLDVTEPTTPTPTPSATPTQPSTSASTSSATPTATTEPEAQTATVPETPTATDDTGTLPTLRPPSETLVPKDDSTPTETGGIITPGAPETDGTDDETVTGGQPGFIIVATLLALLFVTMLYRNR
jgi:hypothetical protein